jgi:hypothetical protein
VAAASAFVARPHHFAIEEAALGGKTKAALSAIEGQRRARAGLVNDRKREAATLATLQAERASVAARGHQIETESAPICYVAELVGADTDKARGKPTTGQIAPHLPHGHRV